MPIIYVDPISGDNTNSGSSWATSFKTLEKAIQSVSSQNSIIYISSGRMLEGNIEFTMPEQNYSGLRIIAAGSLTIDSDGNDYCFIYPYKHIGADAITFINIRFIGFNKSVIKHENSDDSYHNTHSRFIRCTIYQKGDLYQKTQLIESDMTGCPHYQFFGCTIYGMDMSSYPNFYRLQIQDSILYRNTNYINNSNCSNYNASESAYFYGNNYIDTSIYTPPFKKAVYTNPDLMLDQSDGNFNLYMTSGSNGAMLGHMPLAVTCWTSPIYTGINDLKIYDGSIRESWVNDEYYFGTSFKPVTIDTSNNAIDFYDSTSMTQKTAYIAEGTYHTGVTFALAVYGAFVGATYENYINVSYDPVEVKITITATIPTFFQLIFNSGTHKSTSAASLMGFDIDSDYTGSLFYTSQSHLAIGPGDDASSNAGNIEYDELTHGLYISKFYNNSATKARVVSPVVDLYVAGKIRYANPGFMNDSTGTIENIQMRASQISFAYNDPPGSTPLDWSDITANVDFLTDVNKYRYIQSRIIIVE